MKEIEAGIIGIWLSNLKKEYIPNVSEKDFVHYNITYKAIRTLYDQGKDINPQLCVGEYTISELFGLTSSIFPNSIEDYIGKLKESAVKKKIKLLAESDLTSDIMAEKILHELKTIHVMSKSNLSIEHCYNKLFDELLDRRENLKTSIKYGIPLLDDVTNGIGKGSLTIIAGRPGTGKSAFGTQLAYNAAAEGRKVLMFSLEMGESELTERILNRYDLIENHRIKKGEFTAGDKEQLRNLKEEFKLLDILIDTKARTISDIRNQIAKHKPDLIIVDQIGLMTDVERTSSRREALVNISRKLKLTAMDFQIPIVALAQLNRDAQENFPTIANLKESGSLEEDANTVIMLHKMTPQQSKEIGFSMNDLETMKERSIFPVMIMLAKNRNGVTKNIVGEFIGSKYIFKPTERIKK